jgi:hypothetical protein
MGHGGMGQEEMRSWTKLEEAQWRMEEGMNDVEEGKRNGIAEWKEAVCGGAFCINWPKANEEKSLRNLKNTQKDIQRRWE